LLIRIRSNCYTHTYIDKERSGWGNMKEKIKNKCNFRNQKTYNVSYSNKKQEKQLSNF